MTSLKSVPDRIKMATIKMWCNGWILDSRFGQSRSQCPTGCPSRSASLRHLVQCERYHAIFEGKTRVDLDNNWWEILALGASNREERIRVLTTLYATHLALGRYNTVRSRLADGIDLHVKLMIGQYPRIKDAFESERTTAHPRSMTCLKWTRSMD